MALPQGSTEKQLIAFVERALWKISPDLRTHQKLSHSVIIHGKEKTTKRGKSPKKGNKQARISTHGASTDISQGFGGVSNHNVKRQRSTIEKSAVSDKDKKWGSAAGKRRKSRMSGNRKKLLSIAAPKNEDKNQGLVEMLPPGPGVLINVHCLLNDFTEKLHRGSLSASNGLPKHEPEVAIVEINDVTSDDESSSCVTLPDDERPTTRTAIRQEVVAYRIVSRQRNCISNSEDEKFFKDKAAREKLEKQRASFSRSQETESSFTETSSPTNPDENFAESNSTSKNKEMSEKMWKREKEMDSKGKASHPLSSDENWKEKEDENRQGTLCSRPEISSNASKTERKEERKSSNPDSKTSSLQVSANLRKNSSNIIVHKTETQIEKLSDQLNNTHSESAKNSQSVQDFNFCQKETQTKEKSSILAADDDKEASLLEVVQTPNNSKCSRVSSESGLKHPSAGSDEHSHSPSLTNQKAVSSPSNIRSASRMSASSIHADRKAAAAALKIVKLDSEPPEMSGEGSSRTFEIRRHSDDEPISAAAIERRGEYMDADVDCIEDESFVLEKPERHSSSPSSSSLFSAISWKIVTSENFDE